MTNQTDVFTAAIALVTADKASMAEHAAFVYGTAAAIGTMLFVFDSAIHTHFTFITPNWSTFAAIITVWTWCAVNVAHFTGWTMTIVVHGTEQAHMTILAPVIIFAAVTAVLTVIFFITAAAAFFTAVITAGAYVIVTAEGTAEFTITFVVPCESMSWE